MTSTPTDSNRAGARPVECDVLVIGGGPAGATAAALLAGQGRSVALVERECHPRFHIGESLLPANLPLLDRLGVRAEVEAIGMPKYGVEFVSPTHDHVSRIEFSEAWDKSMPYAYQVRRSQFDEILFRNAERAGAQGFENTRIRQVDFDADGVSATAESASGALSFRARYVIDASGRDTLLANKLRSKLKNREHNSSALYAHFTDVDRLPGKMEGHISIFWFAHGWFWFIPLPGGQTSIGAVCWPYYLKSRTKPLDEFFADTIASCPALAQRLAHAERSTPVQATGNYSYSGTHSTGDRYLMAGDAFAFVDPVFSSGVFLAMNSAFAAAELVSTRLDEPARYAAEAQRYEQLMKRGPREFSWFIYRMTNPTMREFFMHPANPMRVKEAMLSLLAGDIFGKTPIWPSLYAMKGFYYLFSLRHLPRTVAAWRQRRINIRDVELESGPGVAR
ncbi:NAD(P)/FAD-dependent oxidoreductase [soil metagenome]